MLPGASACIRSIFFVADELPPRQQTRCRSGFPYFYFHFYWGAGDAGCLEVLFLVLFCAFFWGACTRLAGAKAAR